jgi:hypothetical protein
MPSTVQSTPVDVRPALTAGEFYAEYVNRKPVVLKRAIASLPAVGRWSLRHFAEVAPDLPVRLKVGRVAEGKTSVVPLAEYAQTVRDWEAIPDDAKDGQCPPPYLHDVPMLALIPGLQKDLEPFPGDLLPRFFADSWWKFPQFFVGPSRSETSLHFDTLLTHNLFFQMHGAKRFAMVDASQRDRCYTRNWRWSPVDPDAPDLQRFPRFEGVPIREAQVEAGDLLYMPPGTLHKVTSKTESVSFNIDWHDRRSAVNGLLAVRDRMPVQNLRYNTLLALGVCCRVPLKVLMPALRSYFVYIS